MENSIELKWMCVAIGRRWDVNVGQPQPNLVCRWWWWPRNRRPGRLLSATVASLARSAGMPAACTASGSTTRTRIGSVIKLGSTYTHTRGDGVSTWKNLIFQKSIERNQVDKKLQRYWQISNQWIPILNDYTSISFNLISQWKCCG